jgi:hypothetical protein
MYNHITGEPLPALSSPTSAHVALLYILPVYLLSVQEGEEPSLRHTPAAGSRAAVLIQTSLPISFPPQEMRSASAGRACTTQVRPGLGAAVLTRLVLPSTRSQEGGERLPARRRRACGRRARAAGRGGPGQAGAAGAPHSTAGRARCGARRSAAGLELDRQTHPGSAPLARVTARLRAQLAQTLDLNPSRCRACSCVPAAGLCTAAALGGSNQSIDR